MMRWLNLPIILIYLSILLSPPVKAVTQNRVDLVGSGLSVQNAIMPMAQHLPGQSVVQHDSSDDGYVFDFSIVAVSTEISTVLPVALPYLHSLAILLAQPRAPPSLS